jgi:hypothetical protein
MSAAALPFYLRWLCANAVNALLRPVFLRYRAEVEAGRVKMAEIYWRRFTGLVAAAPCWPCRVEWDREMIWITTSDDSAGDVDEIDDGWRQDLQDCV